MTIDDGTLKRILKGLLNGPVLLKPGPLPGSLRSLLRKNWAETFYVGEKSYVQITSVGAAILRKEAVAVAQNPFWEIMNIQPQEPDPKPVPRCRRCGDTRAIRVEREGTTVVTPCPLCGNRVRDRRLAMGLPEKLEPLRYAPGGELKDLTEALFDDLHEGRPCEGLIVVTRKYQLEHARTWCFHMLDRHHKVPLYCLSQETWEERCNLRFGDTYQAELERMIHTSLLVIVDWQAPPPHLKDDWSHIVTHRLYERRPLVIITKEKWPTYKDKALPPKGLDAKTWGRMNEMCYVVPWL